MKEIDELLSLVMPYAPECPEPLAIRALRNAATKVCERGRLWKETVTLAVIANESVPLAAPAGARIMEFAAPIYDGEPLTPVSLSWLDYRNPQWRDDEASPAQYLTQEAPNTVRVVPFVAGTLSLRLVLLPAKAATELPDFLVDDYATEISEGAIAEVLLTPAVDFANPKLGVAFSQRFEAHLDRISVAATKGQQKARLRTKASFM